MSAHVVQSDAGRLPLADNTVDLIVTSPPYFGLRSYTDGGEHYTGQVGDEDTPTAYLDRLIACTAEWMRVLKPSGNIFVNLGDKYAGNVTNHSRQEAIVSTAAAWAKVKKQGYPHKSLMMLPARYAIRCVDELGLIQRAEIIWSKPNGLPESVTDRVRRSHEQVFHFTKEPRYFAGVDEIREPVMFPMQSRTMGDSANGGNHSGQTHKRQDGGSNPLGKLPGSVWTIPTAPLSVPASLGVDHFAAFPPELVRQIVLGWSPRLGVCLDPFGGTGTTALVADCYGRVGISVDLSHDYSRVATWRTRDPLQRQRAGRVRVDQKLIHDVKVDLLELL